VNKLFLRRAAQFPTVLALALCAACTTMGGAVDEGEPVIVGEEPPAEAVPEVSLAEEGEVPLVVAQSEHPVTVPPVDTIDEIIVAAPRRDRHEVIHDLVSEAIALLQDVELQYVFTGKGKREILRGRPVAFALWSDKQQDWTVAHIEIGRPPIKWKPGGKPIPFKLLTPGLKAKHVTGTGAERLMFAFSRDGEPLKVYGRKFPVFDAALLKKKQWRAVAKTAKPIIYLPFTEDTFDPLFVSGGKDYLLSTARQAIEELRLAKAPSAAFPGEYLADIVPAEVIATLAVIEQTDDGAFVKKKADAFNDVLSQYGLKRDEAYRYSVSRASALGPMQFTNRWGNGTYALVVRKCRAAKLDPNFERGATNLLNAMKAAICLFDIELAQMRPEIRHAYAGNMEVLGIFPVAAYNGGPRNVTKLYNTMKKMGVKLEDLRLPGEQAGGKPVNCPCLWREADTGVRPVAIPRYNNENRWYSEKYQTILKEFS
jgi:hypothetical protein